jgi:hypothetical protein
MPPKRRGSPQLDKTDSRSIFGSAGPHLQYTHTVPWGTSVNNTYTIKVLGKFMDHLKRKRPAMAQQQCWFHKDNKPMHLAASVKGWLTAKKVQVQEHLHYLLDLNT